MQKTLILTALVLLTSCAAIRTSPLNPLNWFGAARQAPTTALIVAAADPRALVAQVTDLVVEPTNGGAIIRATGLPPTQGYWEAELVKVETDDPTSLTYEFRIFPPITPQRSGTPLSREVVVAEAVSNVTLGRINSITVMGANNALSSGR